MFAVHAHKLDMHVQNLTASRNFHSSTCYFQKLLVVRLFVGKLNVRLFLLLPWKTLSQWGVVKVDQVSAWCVASARASIFARYVPLTTALFSRLIIDYML